MVRSIREVLDNLGDDELYSTRVLARQLGIIPKSIREHSCDAGLRGYRIHRKDSPSNKIYWGNKEKIRAAVSANDKLESL